MNEDSETKILPRLWNANYTKVWSANFMIFFSFMLVMPLLPLYMTDEFGAGKHTIGVVLSGYTVTALFARLFSGYIVDTFNRRNVLLLSYGLFACFFLGYLIGGSMILFAIVRTLHGAPFGTTTVSNSTVAIDVLPSERRAEGIGYYGLANNLGTAISPTIGLFLYEAIGSIQSMAATYISPLPVHATTATTPFLTMQCGAALVLAWRTMASTISSSTPTRTTRLSP